MIENESHFGDVQRAGLCCAVFHAWPGPILEGGGEMQTVIDERADPAQRAALETVLTGGERAGAATDWWVIRAMSDTVHPTLFLPIAYEVHIDARRARVAVPGVLEASGRPIRPPHSEGEHRVQIAIRGYRVRARRDRLGLLARDGRDCPRP